MGMPVLSTSAIGVWSREMGRPSKTRLYEPQKSSLSSPMRGERPHNSVARELNQRMRPCASQAQIAIGSCSTNSGEGFRQTMEASEAMSRIGGLVRSWIFICLILQTQKPQFLK